MPRNREKEKYVRIGDRADKGDYQLVDPFHYLILAILPDEGTLMGGFYPIGETMTSMRRRFPGLSSGVISANLSVLRKQGLAVMAGGDNSSKKSMQALGWQRTARGKQVFEDWTGKEKHSEWLQAQKQQQT